MPIDNYPLTNFFGAYIPILNIKIVNPDTKLSLSTKGIKAPEVRECAITASAGGLFGHQLAGKGESMEIHSINIKVMGYSYKATIEILKPNSDELLYRIQNVPVNFVPIVTNNLLGVKGFLENFVLNVNYPAKNFPLKHP